MALRIDESQFPLIVIELRGALEPADVHAFIAGGERWLAARRPYALVIEPIDMGLPTFASLKPLLGWMKEHDRELERWFQVFAMVTTSAVLRGGLRGILALRPITAAQRVTATRAEAVAWAREALARSR